MLINQSSKFFSPFFYLVIQQTGIPTLTHTHLVQKRTHVICPSLSLFSSFLLLTMMRYMPKPTASAQKCKADQEQHKCHEHDLQEFLHLKKLFRQEEEQAIITAAVTPTPPCPKSSRPEPLLTPNLDHFVLYPIKHESAFTMYKKQLACFWTPEEIDLSKDKADFNKLSKAKQHFILMTLAFFATSDGIVAKNLITNFASKVQILEVCAFYTLQAAMETIHGETYSLLINTYLAHDEEQKPCLFHGMNTMLAVAQKGDFVLNWCDTKQHPFATHLIAFAAVEGVFFSTSFCAIFWAKQHGLLPDLSFSNELISHNETLHCDFVVLLHKMLLHPVQPYMVHNIVWEAVEIECKFAQTALPTSLMGA
jgi:ribonucleoside-diphosphate reductase beta chain